MTKHQGIEIRHKRACSSRGGETCNCKPSFQAQVWSKRDGKPIKKTFPGLRAAERWRSNMITDLVKGTAQAPSRATLRETAEAWLEGVKAGTILTRSGRPYKPARSTVGFGAKLDAADEAEERFWREHPRRGRSLQPLEEGTSSPPPLRAEALCAHKGGRAMRPLSEGARIRIVALSGLPL
jgi:hypothetical protein